MVHVAADQHAPQTGNKGEDLITGIPEASSRQALDGEPNTVAGCLTAQDLQGLPARCDPDIALGWINGFEAGMDHRSLGIQDLTQAQQFA